MWAAKALVKKKIPLTAERYGKNVDVSINRGEEMTITKGKNMKYALWHGTGIYDLPNNYIGKIVRIISKD